MKKTIIACSLLMAIVCSCLTTFALPPSGGGTECPDRCKTNDQICCMTSGGSSYMGALP